MNSYDLLSLTCMGQSRHRTADFTMGLPPLQSERDLMLDRQSFCPATRTGAVTSRIAALGSGGWGTVYGSWSLALARTGQRGHTAVLPLLPPVQQITCP